MHDESTLEDWVRQRSERVAEGLSTDPYVRSARLLGYSLRSQVRGFFHDPHHPVARTLLAHLHAVVTESGDATEPMLHRVERIWAEGDHPVLAGAWKALVKDASNAIEHARRQEPTPSGVDLDDPARDVARDEAFAAWLAATTDDQSM